MVQPRAPPTPWESAPSNHHPNAPERRAPRGLGGRADPKRIGRGRPRPDPSLLIAAAGLTRVRGGSARHGEGAGGQPAPILGAGRHRARSTIRCSLKRLRRVVGRGGRGKGRPGGPATGWDQELQLGCKQGGGYEFSSVSPNDSSRRGLSLSLAPSTHLLSEAAGRNGAGEQVPVSPGDDPLPRGQNAAVDRSIAFRRGRRLHDASPLDRNEIGNVLVCGARPAGRSVVGCFEIENGPVAYASHSCARMHVSSWSPASR